MLLMASFALLVIPFSSASVDVIFPPLLNNTTGGGNGSSVWENNTANDAIQIKSQFPRDIILDNGSSLRWTQGAVIANGFRFDTTPFSGFTVPSLVWDNVFQLGAIERALYVKDRTSETPFIFLTPTNSVIEYLGLQYDANNNHGLIAAQNANMTIGSTDQINIDGATHINLSTPHLIGNFPVTLQLGKDIGRATSPVGSCGTKWWGRAFIGTSFYEVQYGFFNGFDALSNRTLTVPCNGTITQVGASFAISNFNQTGNVNHASINTSFYINQVEVPYFSFIPSTNGHINTLFTAQQAVNQGDQLAMIYNINVTGTGIDPDNDLCVDEITNVVYLLCET